MRTSRAIPMLALVLSLAACGDTPAETLANARAAYERSDYGAARVAVVAALRKEPNDVEMLTLLAQSQLRLGDAEGAEQTLSRLIGRIAPDEHARLTGDLRLLQGRAQDALAGLNPEDESPTAWRIRAAAFVALGKASDAQDAYGRGMAAGPDVQLAAAYARYLLESGAVEVAARVHRTLESFAPEAFEALMLQGDLAVARGQSKSAVAAYRRAAQLYPQRHEPLLALARELPESSSHEAMELLEKAQALTGGSAEIFEAQVALHATRREWGAVRAALQGQASGLDPTSALALTYGEALLHLGQPEQARTLFTRARLLRPRDPYTRFMLGRAQLATGDAEDAWATLSPLADSALAPAELIEAAVAAARAVGHPDEKALRARLRPVRLKQRMAIVDKAQAALDRQDWGAARAALLLIPAGSDDPEVLMRLALASSRLGRHHEAITYADQALVRRPDAPECLHTAGMARFEAGDVQKAQALLRRAADADPRNEGIREDLEKMRPPAA
ncbi:tetratricopeptide repeat protein [Novosphingobium sp. RD2P27]|uniref:Tetratricopeptide repeat protein n=1 Tax=Novosphingobium kalidii TaxID=3230299 RepID=A0ABV2D2E4_9SPHN